MTDKLDAILSREGPLKKIRGNHHLIPFGGLVYKGKVILARLDTYQDSNDRLHWKPIPFGLRKGNSSSFFDSTEEYHDPGVTEARFMEIVAASIHEISDFIATVYPTQKDPPIWDNFQNELNVQLHPALVEAVRHIYHDCYSLLDVGAGPGKLASAIKAAYPPIDVYALDLNEENAQETSRVLGADKVRQGDVCNLASLFEGKKFDVIVASALLECEVLDYRSVAVKALESIHQQLNPGGYLIASGYTPLLLNRKDFEQAGFEVLSAVVPENLFTFDLPKQLYVARKPSSSS